MTLQDAVDIQFYNHPSKRIVRKPNTGGWVDVHFVYDHSRGLLMVRSYTCRVGLGMELGEKPAPFQMSDHTDWILI